MIPATLPLDAEQAEAKQKELREQADATVLVASSFPLVGVSSGIEVEREELGLFGPAVSLHGGEAGVVYLALGELFNLSVSDA